MCVCMHTRAIYNFAYACLCMYMCVSVVSLCLPVCLFILDLKASFYWTLLRYVAGSSYLVDWTTNGVLQML